MGAAAKRLPTRQLPDWLVRLVALFDPSVQQILPELGKRKNATNEKAKRLLGWSPRSNEECIVATAESLVRSRAAEGQREEEDSFHLPLVGRSASDLSAEARSAKAEASRVGGNSRSDAPTLSAPASKAKRGKCLARRQPRETKGASTRAIQSPLMSL